MEKPNLYICHTPYHVLMSCVYASEQSTKPHIVLCATIPEYKLLADKIREQFFFENVVTLDEQKIKMMQSHDILWKEYIVHFINKFQMEHRMHFKIDASQYNEVWIFNDWTNMGRYLQDKKIFYNISEDGIGARSNSKFNPVIENQRKEKWFRLKQKRKMGYLFSGDSSLVEKIEVHKKEGVQYFPEKVYERNRLEIFDSLEQSVKDKLLDIFLPPEMLEIETKNIEAGLLLTQPFALDRQLPSAHLQEKVFFDLVEQYFQGYVLFIKPHPRDTMNYHKLFPQAIMLPASMPMEILRLIHNFHWSIAVTVFSSALESIKNVDKKVFLGEEYLKKYCNSQI